MLSIFTSIFEPVNNGMPVILGCDVRNQDPQTGNSEDTRTEGQRVMMSMVTCLRAGLIGETESRKSGTAINLKSAKSFKARI